ncbi:hypothetical protein F5Y05DRAFT_389244 [Hypoxylon sp. FL0543]|nr:hypothetical protein F5Y05DRAFT_389244 [Hypoxylon sp. FL0543]
MSHSESSSPNDAIKVSSIADKLEMLLDAINTLRADLKSLKTPKTFTDNTAKSPTESPTEPGDNNAIEPPASSDAIDSHVRKDNATKSCTKCEKCHKQFQSRNKLMKHVFSNSCRGARNEEAPSESTISTHLSRETEELLLQAEVKAVREKLEILQREFAQNKEATTETPGDGDGATGSIRAAPSCGFIRLYGGRYVGSPAYIPGYSRPHSW